MKSEIPDHLTATADMVKRAYPNGIPSDEYFPLLAVLAEHLSNENLAILADSWFPERSYRLNDVLTALTMTTDAENILVRLRAAGFDEWLKED